MERDEDSVSPSQAEALDLEYAMALEYEGLADQAEGRHINLDMYSQDPKDKKTEKPPRVLDANDRMSIIEVLWKKVTGSIKLAKKYLARKGEFIRKISSDPKHDMTWEDAQYLYKMYGTDPDCVSFLIVSHHPYPAMFDVPIKVYIETESSGSDIDNFECSMYYGNAPRFPGLTEFSCTWSERDIPGHKIAYRKNDVTTSVYEITDLATKLDILIANFYDFDVYLVTEPSGDGKTQELKEVIIRNPDNPNDPKAIIDHYIYITPLQKVKLMKGYAESEKEDSWEKTGSEPIVTENFTRQDYYRHQGDCYKKVFESVEPDPEPMSEADSEDYDYFEMEDIDDEYYMEK